MTVYFILLFLVYVISIIDSRKINKIDLLFFIVLTIVAGFRYGVGTDFFNYVEYFNLIKTGYEVPAEPGFIFLSNIILKLNLNSQALFIALSGLTMLFLYKGIKYHTKDNYTFKPVLYIILLLFTFLPSLNVVRQVLAASIILYASKYIINRKIIKFYIWVLFATLFHYASIIFLVFYFLASKNFKRTTLLFTLFLSYLLANFGLISTILDFIYVNFSFLDIGGYLERYLYSSYNERDVSYGVVFYTNFFTLLLFIILKNRLINNEKALLSFNFFYLYILSYTLSMDASMLTRLNYYFGIYMAISISRFGILFDNDSKKVVEYILVGLYSTLYIFIIINGYINPDQTDYIPYEYNLKLTDN